MRRAFYGLVLCGVFLSAWAFWWEPASLNNESHALAIPNWPSGCAETRVAVLADLHVGSPHNGLDKLDQIIAVTQAADPDLILLAGDYVIQGVVGGTVTSPEAIAKQLAKLSAPLGVYAVLGNHDWWLDSKRVQRALESVGIKVLEDDAMTIQANSRCEFWLAGISDFWEGAHDVGKALAKVPPEAAVIAFTHNPDIFPQIPARVALTIAGHTHGGQVCIPVVGRPIVPSQYGERFAAGHIIEQGRHLFVSTGLGTSIIPVRFLVPPEVSILKLHSEKGGFSES